MKNTNNMKLRIIASTLAALSIMSATAVTTSAVNVTDAETPIAGTYGEHAKSDFNHDVQVINPEFALLDNTEVNAMLSELGYKEETEDAKSKAKDIIDAMAKGLVNSGIDMLGSAFPGGKLLSGALKAILGEATKDEDPIDALAEQEQQHFEELKDRIGQLDRSISDCANQLKSEVIFNNQKITLGGLFTTLSTNLKDLSDRMEAIVGCDSYSPEQKRVLLAELNIGGGNNEKDLVAEVRQAADAISRTLSGNGGVLGTNLYSTLLGLCQGSSMFRGEAMNAAMDTAKVLTEQYMYANTLLLQCQSAGTNLNFTDKQIEALDGDSYIMNAYRNCTRAEVVRFQETKFKDTLTRLQNGLETYKGFLDSKVQNNRLINQGKNSEEIILEFHNKNYNYITGGNLEKMYKEQQYFKGKEINEFVDFIRNATGGKKSIADYLNANGQRITEHTTINGGNCVVRNPFDGMHSYIVVDPKITVKEKQTKFVRGIGEYGVDQYYYDAAEVIKVVDIYDPECKVQELVIRTWTKRRNGNGYEWKENIRDCPHDYITIGSHIATEKDDMHTYADGNLDIRGPKIKVYDDINAPKADKNIKVPKIK